MREFLAWALITALACFMFASGATGSIGSTTDLTVCGITTNSCVLFAEDFDGAYPCSLCAAADSNATNGLDFWGKATCNTCAGSGVLWCAQNGNQTTCNRYDDNMDAWFTVGPIASRGYSNLRVYFQYKFEMQSNPSLDWFDLSWSSDGTNWTRTPFIRPFSGVLRNPAWPACDTADFVVPPGAYDQIWFKWKFHTSTNVSNRQGAYLDCIVVTGDIPRPTVTCVNLSSEVFNGPCDVTSVKCVNFDIRNNASVAMDYDWQLNNLDRSWPGFPYTGTATAIPPGGTTTVPVCVTIPDTARSGGVCGSGATAPMRLTFYAWPKGTKSLVCADSCGGPAGGGVPTPALASLAGADWDGRRVRIAWHLGAGGAATLERRRAGSEWTPIATLLPDGRGLVEYEDRAVERDRTYGYRLRIRDGAREVLAGETWVSTGSAPGLGILSLAPNPTTGEVAVTCALPRGVDGLLEVLDVAGRRIEVRSVDAPPGGLRVVALGVERPLAPGVYLVRLSRGASAVTRRLVVVR